MIILCLIITSIAFGLFASAYAREKDKECSKMIFAWMLLCAYVMGLCVKVGAPEWLRLFFFQF